MDTPYSYFETEVSVRPDDIDLNQHVHNSKYLDYVLAARYEQMERCYHMGMPAFAKRQLNWFVREAHIEHKRPLHLGDVALVRTAVTEIGSRTVTVGFEIDHLATKKRSAQGSICYAMVDAGTGRLREIPEDIRDSYSI